jgi:dienelactone hydrolase
MRRAVLLAMVMAWATVQPAPADELYREELRIPMAAAGPRGLEALLIRPARMQPYPLAVISHGSPGAALRRDMTPYGYYRQAIEFARRGFAALVVMRRGNGDSGGEAAEAHSCCSVLTFLRSAKSGADDIRTAIAAMKSRADVTTKGMIAVGVSAGGLATVALTAAPPPGLAAAINFAGGVRRTSPGSTGIHNDDDETALVSAFKTLGKTSRTPMLWVYAENDAFFGPDLAHRMLAAFGASGGRAQLIDAPAFGTDGHALFGGGIWIWTRMVDDFLREQKLGNRDLLAFTPPALPPPPLGEKGRAAFADYLAAGLHKAFATSPTGKYWYWAEVRSPVNAQNQALAGCAKYAPDCTLYAIENELAAPADAHR